MLALTRKPGERIMIGEDVIVTVVDVKGDSVRLAIEAPKSVKILRGEIYEAIERENKQAAIGNSLTLDSLNKIAVIKRSRE